MSRTYTVTLGSFKSRALVYRALRKAECWVHVRAEDMLQRAVRTMSPKKVQVRLVVLSVAELGFAEASYQEVCARAHQLGYAFCSAEVGFLLRLRYLDQKGSESLYIAMEPMLNPADPFIFVLTKGFGGLLLYSEWAHPHSLFCAKDQFVFVQS